jgi:hypothetical protein
MDTSSLPFSIRTATRELIDEVERIAGMEIVLRESDFTKFDEAAAVSGGFDSWVPHVTVNRQRAGEFDEHGLFHELLHIKRFLEGAYILETPEFVAGVTGQDVAVRKAFANDVTNQIEHIAIFPLLTEAGFNPNAQYDAWKMSQIESFEATPDANYGSVEVAWLSIKAGISHILGESREVHDRYSAAIRKEVPDAFERGIEVAKLIRRYGVEKQYNLKRLYELMLRTAGVPKRALLLKKFDFKNRSETLETIP